MAIPFSESVLKGESETKILCLQSEIAKSNNGIKLYASGAFGRVTIRADIAIICIGYMMHIWFVYITYRMVSVGIVKISEDLHEEIRKSSSVMSRSINSQAEFWMKMGMLAELNPNLSYGEIIQQQLKEQAFDMSRCDLEVVASEKKSG